MLLIISKYSSISQEKSLTAGGPAPHVFGKGALKPSHVCLHVIDSVTKLQQSGDCSGGVKSEICNKVSF